MKSKHFSNA